MPDKISFRKTFHALEDALGIVKQRHAIIIGNISNLDTPGYRAKDMDFKTTLSQALDPEKGVNLVKTNPKHMVFRSGPTSNLELFEEKGEWNGLNWVNLDHTMTKLMENSLLYRVATEALLRKIAIIKEVLREGGR